MRMAAIPRASTTPDRRNSVSRDRLLDRVRGEFREMPCLRLTFGQAQRLFSMRADICERVFASLVREGMLTRGPDARYGVRADVAWHEPMAGPRNERRTTKAS
jgi:hypothetical protein